MPHLTEIHASKLEVSLLDRFSVSFGVEGGSISLACTMVVVPDLPNVPPLTQWYRDGNSFVRCLAPGHIGNVILCNDSDVMMIRSKR